MVREWKSMKLGEMAAIKSGGTPSRAKPEYWNGRIPWIGTSKINYATIASADEYITETGLKNSSTRIFPPGTLLIALYGQGATRGRVGILGRDMAINQACAAIIPKRELDYRYAYFYLEGQYENLRNFAQGGNQANLSAKLLAQYEIKLPPLPEQRKIAEILSCWDRAIEKTEEICRHYKNRIKAFRTHYLTGKQRLRGYNGNWKKTSLGELLVEHKDKSKGIEQVFSVSVHKGLVNQIEHLGRSFAAADTSNYNLVHYGDVAYYPQRRKKHH